MKSILKTSTVSAFAFAIFMTIFFYFKYGKIAIVETFLFLFLGWGILSFIFLLFMSKKNDEIAQNFDGEICYKGLANHFVGIEGVGGHLFITKDGIMFKSHAFNVQNHSIEIPFKDILEVKTYNNLGIIPNGLAIVQSNKTDKFVVTDRKKIVEILNSFIS